MYNIDYYQQYIDSPNSLAYNSFMKLYDKKLLYQPKIFSDKCLVYLKNSIPIFHSFYIRQHYHNRAVMIGYDDVQYVDHYYNQNFIVVYNDSNDIQNLKDKYLCYNLEYDIVDFLKENYHDAG